MKSFRLKLAASLLALMPTGAFAQGCVASMDAENVTVVSGELRYQSRVLVHYIADIAERDLYNSRGVRLSNFAAILQQDRANVHKTGRLDGDAEFTEGFDVFFTTAERRALLSAGPYYFDCASAFSSDYSDELKRYIESGRIPGFLSVVVFREPFERLAFYISIVG